MFRIFNTNAGSYLSLAEVQQGLISLGGRHVDYSPITADQTVLIEPRGSHQMIADLGAINANPAAPINVNIDIDTDESTLGDRVIIRWARFVGGSVFIHTSERMLFTLCGSDEGHD